MKKEDLEQVCAIEKEAFTLPWSREAFLEGIRMKDSIYLVACEQNVVIAYCGVWVIAGEGQINNIAVAKEYRGRGAGYELLSYLLLEGEKRGVEAFTLEVRVSNEAAIRLYEKAGFEKLGIRRGFYEKPVEDAAIMTVITSRKACQKPI